MQNLISLTSIIILFFSGCIKPACFKHYAFEAPLEVAPLGSTLHIGDTMYVKMITNNKVLYDTLRRRIVEFPDFNPMAAFRLPIIDSFPVKEGFILNEVIVDTSKYDIQFLYTEHLGLGLYFFDIPKNEYESRIEFKVVFKTPGQYMLACSDGLFFYDKSKKIKFPDRCGYGDLEVYFNIIQGNHIEILSNSHKEVLIDYWKHYSGVRAGTDKYYFKVLK